MTDEQIITIAKKHDLNLGIYYSPTSWYLVDNGDGTSSFKHPDGLTPYGENLVAFARSILAASK